MKKNYSILTGCAFVAVSFSACVEKGDFDTSSISLQELKPTFLLPLVHDTLTLTKNAHITYIGDTAAFFYPIDALKFPEKSEWFDSKTFPQSSSFTVQITGGEGKIDLPLNNLPTGDKHLDSARMNITVDVTDLNNLLQSTSDALVVSCKDILYKNQEMALTFVKGESSQSLTNCVIRLGIGRSTLPLQVRIKASTIPSTLNMKMSIDTFARSAVYGYFGQITPPIIKDSVMFDFFNDLNISGNVNEFKFGDFKWTTDIRNSIGIPLQLTMCSATVYYKDGSSTVTPINQSLTITGPKNNSPFETVVNRDTLKNADLFKNINLNTTKIVFYFKIESNPGTTIRPNNLSNRAQTRLLKEGSGILVPLRMHIAPDLILKDTIAVDLSSIATVHNMKLYADFVNSMPINVKLKMTLLDKDSGEELSNLFDTTTIKAPDVMEEIVQGKPVPKSLSEIEFLPSTLEDMKKADRILVTIQLNTTPQDNSYYVRFLRNSMLTIKLRAKTQLNYDSL